MTGKLIAFGYPKISVMETHHEYRQIEALIVEDELDICFLLTGILRKYNLHTAFVNTIHDAEHKLTVSNPGILFLDNNLPDGFGVDFIHYIKANNPLTKIIMISANDAPSDKNKALNAGADFFIGKPFTRNIINETLTLAMAGVH